MYRLNDERGAAAVVVAVFGVALFGMASLALDTAAIYEERRELQNGADAGALAIAEDCFRIPASCVTGPATVTAAVYADANADDGVSSVDELALDPVGQSVTVSLRTEDLAGGSVITPYFGRVLGFDGASVAAEATAVWGYASSTTGVPLIISDCEWEDANRPELQSDPPYDGDPWLFVFHQGNHGGECEHSNSGFDLPGGFGWLDTETYPCQADVEVGAEVEADPGSSPSQSCNPTLLKDLLFEQVVYLPYYDTKEGSGNNITYTVSGVGAFYITGYNFGGQYKEPSGNVPCSGSARCLAGYFVTATTSNGEPGGPNRGLSIIKLTS